MGKTCQEKGQRNNAGKNRSEKQTFAGKPVVEAKRCGGLDF
jgi:hypothetical protein